MFWALEQRKKRREAFRAQVREEARKEMSAEFRAMGRTEMLEDLQSKATLSDDGEAIADWLERAGRELEDSRKN